MTRKQLERTAERLIRLAYDLEQVAARLNAHGHDRYGYGVKDLASKAGRLGRDILDATSLS